MPNTKHIARSISFKTLIAQSSTLFFLILFFFTDAPLFANCLKSQINPSRERDFEAVQTFVNSKRTVPMFDKEKELKLSGDVRSEIYYREEYGPLGRIRGGISRDTNQFRPSNWTYEVIVNFQVDYRYEKTWAQAKVKYDNAFGIQGSKLACKVDPDGLFGSGTFRFLCLKTSYLGYRVYDCNNHTLDLEFGRRGQLYKVFDSLIEFNSVLDGIFVRYRAKQKPDWLIYAQGAAFVVDERVRHYAFAMEVGTLDFFETGWDFKYSLIDWMKHGENQCFVNNFQGQRFLVSQTLIAYNFKKPNLLNRKARIYGAFLMNYAAPHVRSLLTSRFHGRQNLGGYIGFIIGEVKKKGDWSIDINWQIAEALVCPDADIHGIGRGNANRETFTGTQRGKTNYQGWHFETLYAVTDKFQLDFTFEFSNQLTKTFGGLHRYRKCELDMIVEF